jgi:hypothetical protein
MFFRKGGSEHFEAYFGIDQWLRSLFVIRFFSEEISMYQVATLITLPSVVPFAGSFAAIKNPDLC